MNSSTITAFLDNDVDNSINNNRNHDNENDNDNGSNRREDGTHNSGEDYGRGENNAGGGGNSSSCDTTKSSTTKKRKSNAIHHHDVRMMGNNGDDEQEGELLGQRGSKRFLLLSEHRQDMTSSDGWDNNNDDDVYDDSNSNDNGDDENGDDDDQDDAYHVDLIQEMNELTFEERERVLYDLHGVSSEGGDILETPDLLEKGLLDVERLLDEESRKPYNVLLRLAMKQFPERIKDTNFRLMFLRAEDWDVRKAVDRILRHLTEQQVLFGDSKVGKRITQDDLSTDDVRALENSHFQLFPEKDRAGRLVIFDSVQHRSIADFSPDSLIRIGFYTMMSGVEGDEMVQRRGVVIVLSYLGNNRRSFGNRESNQNSFQRATQLFRALPLKERAIHGCMNPNRLVGAFDQLLRMGIKRTRTRWRIHQASLTECKYALLSFGIPVRYFPIEDDLSLNRDRHLQWLQQRRELEMEQAMPSAMHQLEEDGAARASGSSIHTGMIVNPTPTDILFGRGKRIQKHAGNRMLNAMVESMLEKYNALDRKKQKTMFSRTVVDMVREKGGRFLRPASTDPKLWEEADDDMAHTKVSHVFRSLRWRQKNNDAQQEQDEAQARSRSHVHDVDGPSYFETPNNDRDAWTSPTPFRWTNL